MFKKIILVSIASLFMLFGTNLANATDV